MITYSQCIFINVYFLFFFPVDLFCLSPMIPLEDKGAVFCTRLFTSISLSLSLLSLQFILYISLRLILRSMSEIE